MKIDPNAPAYPVVTAGEDGVSRDGVRQMQFASQPGMTIRAAMATQIMAALCGCETVSGSPKIVAEQAVRNTDALIAALNEGKP